MVKELSGSLLVSDDKTIAMVYELLDTEGLYVGSTSALNVVAAVELAIKLGKGALWLCFPKNIYEQFHRVKSRDCFV
jgi:cysteine synthase